MHLERRTARSELEARIHRWRSRIRMQTEAPDAFDMTQGARSTSRALRRRHFGRGCLIARRLVERGVRMVQVFFGNGQPWDNHDDIRIASHRSRRGADRPHRRAAEGPESQRPARSDTLVIIGGEFGRTPAVEVGGAGEVQNGRDHNNHGFSGDWPADRNFSGQRTAGEEVEGGYFSFRLHVDPYNSYLEKTGFGTAQVTTLSGTSYAGNFLAPLAIGQTVEAREVVKTSLPSGAVFTYASETSLSGASGPASGADAPALQGTILKAIGTTIHKLLKFGLSDVVGINQPGTVTQDLYLQGGALPAHATSKRHAKRRPAALLLARGVATAKAPVT